MQLKVATSMLQGKLAFLKNSSMEAIIPAQKPSSLHRSLSYQGAQFSDHNNLEHAYAGGGTKLGG